MEKISWIDREKLSITKCKGGKELCKQNQQDALFIYTYIYSIILISSLHVSNDRIVHHQEFSLSADHQKTKAAGHVCTTLYRAVNTVNNEKLLMMDDTIVGNM